MHFFRYYTIIISGDIMENILRLDYNKMLSKNIKITKSRVCTEIGLHWHSYCELLYFYDGILESTINGKRVDLHQGTMYLMSPIDVHRTIVKDKNHPISFINISFTENLLDLSLIQKLNCPYYIDSCDEKMKTLINLIYNSENEAETQHLLNIILHNLISEKNKLFTANESVLNANIIKCIRYIGENYNSNITLTSAANYLHIAPAYLSSLFSKSCRCTFKEYLTQQRISHAKDLLLSTDKTVGEICFACGFSNLSNFFRCFKEQEKITPTEYRKNHKTI